LWKVQLGFGSEKSEEGNTEGRDKERQMSDEEYKTK